MNALRRHAGPAALLLSVFAIVFSVTGLADAAKKSVKKAVSGKVVRLSNTTHKVPSKYLPTVAKAKSAQRLGTQTADDLSDGCAPDQVDLGTWCIMASTVPVENDDVGKNDYFYATQKCASLGGWLPTAAQLIGAARRVKLSSVITDNATNASIDEQAGDGLKDLREMSATLITTAAGSSAAGSEGVSEGSKGDARTGEPDPTPLPSNPAPSTLQYVTVYDNGDDGGFAGSKAVSDPERFRCAFGRTQGQAQKEAD